MRDEQQHQRSGPVVDASGRHDDEAVPPRRFARRLECADDVVTGRAAWPAGRAPGSPREAPHDVGGRPDAA